MQIRHLHPDDSVREITDLLHRAYAEWKEQGLLFVATHQDEITTKERLSRGITWIAEDEGKIIGTLTLRQGHPDSDNPHYRDPALRIFGQFAVDPSYQGSGIGKRMLALAEDHARTSGAKAIVCDTSSQAIRLIELYERWGYSVYGSVDLDCTNYVSVVLRKDLR